MNRISLVFIVGWLITSFSLSQLKTSQLNSSDRSRLVGTWTLVEWTATDPQGNQLFPFGQEASGQLTYGQDGIVSLQLMDPSASQFENEDLTQATSTEIEQAWRKYFAYFGTFTVNDDQKVISHQLKGCTFPNWVGTEQQRKYHFDDDALILTATTASKRSHRLVWKKLD